MELLHQFAGLRDVATASGARLTGFYRLNKQALLSAVIFTSVLFLLETYLFRASYYSQANGRSYITQLRHHSLLPEIFLHVVVVSCSLALFATYVYASLVSSAVYKAIYFVIFT